MIVRIPTGVVARASARVRIDAARSTERGRPNPDRRRRARERAGSDRRGALD
jgi:hypothetical protein